MTSQLQLSHHHMTPNTKLNVEVAKPQIFNRKAEKVLGFLIAYKLFIRMRIRDMMVED